jgi:hypothetical protein
MSVRSEIAAQFSDDWDAIPALAGVRIVVTEREIDDPDRATALIRQRTIGKHPSAPMSHRQVGLLLTLISPHLDLDRAANELDELVTEALDYLDPRYLHEDAQSVGYNERSAYDIPFTVIAQKE